MLKRFLKKGFILPGKWWNSSLEMQKDQTIFAFDFHHRLQSLQFGNWSLWIFFLYWVKLALIFSSRKKWFLVKCSHSKIKVRIRKCEKFGCAKIFLLRSLTDHFMIFYAQSWSCKCSCNQSLSWKRDWWLIFSATQSLNVKDLKIWAVLEEIKR